MYCIYLWSRWIFCMYLHNWWFLQTHQYPLLDFYNMSLFYFVIIIFFFYSLLCHIACTYSTHGYFTCTGMESKVLHVSAVKGVAFTHLYLNVCGYTLFHHFYIYLHTNRWLFCLYRHYRLMFCMRVTVKVFSYGHLKNGRQEEYFCLVLRVVLQEE